MNRNCDFKKYGNFAWQLICSLFTLFCIEAKGITICPYAEKDKMHKNIQMDSLKLQFQKPFNALKFRKLNVS